MRFPTALRRLALAVVALASAVPVVAQEAAPAAVRVETVRRELLSSVMSAPGSVVSLNDARIAAETGGRLTWVAAPGSELEAGALLARIDDTSLNLELRDNEATIKRLEASLRYQARQVSRFEELTKQNIAAANQLEETLAQHDMTREEVNQARVAREQILHRIRQTSVVAPFPGQVVERLRQMGEFVSPGGELVRLVDTRNMEVRAQAPMSVAPFVAPGMQVSVRDRAEREVLSEVRAVIPVGDPRSRLMEVRVALPAAIWPVGSAVRVELPTSEPAERLAVPRDAIILRRDATYVYRVNDNDTVERVDVETGVGGARAIAVTGSLREGDRVVIRGGENLRPGQRVAISAEGESPRAARTTTPDRRG